MPEGNIIHRLARVHHRWLVGRQFTADSPQGRFTQDARRLSGRALVGVEAHGKHLFHPTRAALPPVLPGAPPGQALSISLPGCPAR
ncbi:hypothetical protein [Cystobacter fuscus]|uniref:hypothetical protein n=1 Tax=Cystobacter fuscus TaxID=43 RepID=UPI001E2F3C92|nr:hypothetical protein [Cystobacter fuscus]